MIANNYNEFVDKCSDGIRTVLNTQIGQELTNKLLEAKLKENPNMSPEEWKRTKSEFMTFIFCEFVKEFPEAMEELGTHVFNELKK